MVIHGYCAVSHGDRVYVEAEKKKNVKHSKILENCGKFNKLWISLEKGCNIA